MFDRLGARLGEEQKESLRGIVARLDKRGGRLDLLRWIRGVELTASRVGMLLAGDLRTAMRLIKEEKRSIAELSFEAKRGDLLAYCASEAYGLVRERMGIAIAPAPAPTPPPPSSSASPSSVEIPASSAGGRGGLS